LVPTANRKRGVDFLLVRNSNFGPILHRFRDMTGFMCYLPPPLFNPNFGGVPVAPDRPCWAPARAEALSYSALKLFSKNSNLFEHGT